MIKPVNVHNIAPQVSGAQQNSIDNKTLGAAKSFNSFVLEKMLNINTELKHSDGDKSMATKQMEQMFNAAMAQKVTENNDSLNKRIATEMLR